MSQAKGFDMSKVSTAGKILIIAGGLYFIDLFLQWNRVCFDLGINIQGVDNCAGVAGTHGMGTITMLLALALIAWEVMWVMDVKISAPRALVSAGLAAGIVVFTILKVLIDNEFIYLFAWVGLILALVIGYGGWMRWQEHRAGSGGSAGGGMPAPPSDGMSA
jgi:hypothetical protein